MIEVDKDEVKPSDVDYQWICKWDMALRGQVFELEQMCRNWVDNENSLHQGSTEKKKSSEVSCTLCCQ